MASQAEEPQVMTGESSRDGERVLMDRVVDRIEELDFDLALVKYEYFEHRDMEARFQVERTKLKEDFEDLNI